MSTGSRRLQIVIDRAPFGRKRIKRSGQRIQNAHRTDNLFGFGLRKVRSN